MAAIIGRHLNDSTHAQPREQHYSLSTAAIHADNVLNVVNDVAPPMHVSTTYRYSEDPDKLVSWDERHEKPLAVTEHIYSRHSNSNTTRFETILASLLSAPTVSYASGLTATHAALTLLNPGRVSIGDGYHGHHGAISVHHRISGMKKLPLDCPAEDLHPGDLIMLETPVNPTGRAFNIEYYADKAHSRGAFLMIDSTFAPPPLQDPFKLGADIVMHSGTKYFGGHSDMLCGVLAVRNTEWLKQLKSDRALLGYVMGNFEGWLGVRSLRTLDVRIKRQSGNAERLVTWLATALQTSVSMEALEDKDEREIVRKVVDKVEHASLQKSDLPWLKEQMPHGFGPVFAIHMKSVDLAKKLPSKLSLFHHATSLGGVESLIEWRTMTDETIPKNLLRLSIGIEAWQDLTADLLQGFRKLINEM
ncbi:pyridoxal phosphate-dependent transferase [Xylogone sp. PMI_703]|nr:pyridoxal phosphate-dependent transferase [Xylogone sp. PMI_703]